MALPAGVGEQLPVGVMLPQQPEAAEPKWGKVGLQRRRLGRRASESEIFECSPKEPVWRKSVGRSLHEKHDNEVYVKDLSEVTAVSQDIEQGLVHIN